MRWYIILILIACFSTSVISQESEKPKQQFQIKLEIAELANSFPRLGIGLAAYAQAYNVWSTVHYGWDGIATGYVNNHFDGHYSYVGINAGVNKLRRSGSGYYLMGLEVTYDDTKATATDDVYYDRLQNTAVLFDTAQFHRYRLGIFFKNGYELPVGDLFTIEFSAGIGIRNINNRYSRVVNPFELADVPPVKVRNKTFHKYGGSSWKPALMASIKIGFRL